MWVGGLRFRWGPMAASGFGQSVEREKAGAQDGGEHTLGSMVVRHESRTKALRAIDG